MTARKYRDDGRLPSERKTARNYRTRVDPFEDVWAEVQRKLAAAAIDRLVHHSVIIELNVPSYRVETAKQTKSRDESTANE